MSQKPSRPVVFNILFLIIFITIFSVALSPVLSSCGGTKETTDDSDDGDDEEGDEEEEDEEGGGALSIHPWPMFHGDWTHQGRTTATGPQTNNVKWTFQLSDNNDNAEVGSVAISEDGTIYVAGEDKLVALDSDGNQLWEYAANSLHGPALSEGDTNITVLAGSSIVNVDSAGAEQWSFDDADDAMIFGATLDPDGVAYQGSWDSNFYAVNPDGSLKWSYETAGCVSYPATIDATSGNVYFGGGDAHCGVDDPNLYAFDSDGNLLWTYDTGSIRVGSPALGDDGILYVPASPTLYAIDTDGAMQWSAGELDDETSGIITPAIAADGTVIIGNSDGLITAIDPDTQGTKWTYQTDEDPDDPGFFGVIGFPVIDAQGTVYVGAVDHFMYALNSDGELVWSYEADGRITESSPAIGADGTLYFTSEDGFLYAIGDE